MNSDSTITIQVLFPAEPLALFQSLFLVPHGRGALRTLGEHVSLARRARYSTPPLSALLLYVSLTATCRRRWNAREWSYYGSDEEEGEDDDPGSGRGGSRWRWRSFWTWVASLWDDFWRWWWWFHPPGWLAVMVPSAIVIDGFKLSGTQTKYNWTRKFLTNLGSVQVPELTGTQSLISPPIRPIRSLVIRPLVINVSQRVYCALRGILYLNYVLPSAKSKRPTLRKASSRGRKLSEEQLNKIIEFILSSRETRRTPYSRVI